MLIIHQKRPAYAKNIVKCLQVSEINFIFATFILGSLWIPSCRVFFESVISSFLNVTPKTISKIRRDITFGKD